MSSPSKRTVNLTINGKPYQVEIEDLSASPLRVIVNGEAHEVTVERPTPSTPQPAPSPATAVSAPAPAQPGAGLALATANEIRAPMPGNILDILVQPGDSVEVGQQVCSLEAMKMKSAIRSGQQGVVATVDVSPGQAVAHGDVLLTFK